MIYLDDCGTVLFLLSPGIEEKNRSKCLEFL